MNQWNRLSLQIASLILTGVSIVFTVLLWGQLPDEDWMKIISGLAGFALELCKFSLLPLAVVLLKNSKTIVSGAILLVFGGSLFLVSIGASVAFLENGEQARQRESAVWKDREATLIQLDNNIAIAQSSAEKDIGSRYRQRGLDTLEQVEQWQEQRRTLLKQPVTQSSDTIGLSDNQRFYAWLLLAILIDGCAIAGWTVLSQEQRHNKPLSISMERNPEAFLRTTLVDDGQPEAFLRTSELPSNVADLNDSTVTEKPAIRITKIKEASPETQKKAIFINGDIINRIIEGSHGDVLTIRGLMKLEKIGYVKAKSIIDSLTEDELLIQSDKGYELASNTGEQQCLKYA